MNIDKFNVYLNIVDNMYYSNDAKIVINDLVALQIDDIQVATLNRLIKNKPLRENIIYNVTNTKSCPHCGHENNSPVSGKYIICGYTLMGYDWMGCGRDWCFDCGKKLCKKWLDDMLHNKTNRVHDNKCCKYYAHRNNMSYTNSFCQCDKD